MAMCMRKLDGFSGKELRVAERIIRTMAAENISLDDLVQHNGQFKPDISKPGKKNQTKMPFLKSGEIEMNNDLKCICGGSFCLQALCGMQSIKKGCIRLAVCDTCNDEVKIR